MNTRVIREKTDYDRGLNRESFANILSHSNKGPANERRNVEIKRLMAFGKNRDVLEIGSRTWAGWIDDNDNNWPL